MNVGIVGLGLIGGSIAKALKNKHQISAYDISEETLNYALDNEIVDRIYHNIADFFRDNDVIYLCLYPNSIINFIFQNQSLIPSNSVFIDISGIKFDLIRQINNMNLKNIDIVYTHPIAGSEKIGLTYSNPDIFKKANYVITPIKSNHEKNIDIAKKLAIEMGFLNISMLSPEEHDSIIAYTSQLTHVLSLSLVNSVSTDLDTSKFIGDSYRDLTRISMINDKLWPQLFIGNKGPLLKVIESFEKELDEFKFAIASNDTEKLSKLMKKSTQIRSNIERGDKGES